MQGGDVASVIRSSEKLILRQLKVEIFMIISVGSAKSSRFER